MSNRLDQEREAKLQPVRMKTCKESLESLGLQVFSDGKTKLEFVFRGKKVIFWPYSGWHTGPTVKDGRGFRKLLNQLKEDDEKRLKKQTRN